MELGKEFGKILLSGVIVLSAFYAALFIYDFVVSFVDKKILRRARIRVHERR